MPADPPGQTKFAKQSSHLLITDIAGNHVRRRPCHCHRIVHCQTQLSFSVSYLKYRLAPRLHNRQPAWPKINKQPWKRIGEAQRRCGKGSVDILPPRRIRCFVSSARYGVWSLYGFLEWSVFISSVARSKLGTHDRKVTCIGECRFGICNLRI